MTTNNRMTITDIADKLGVTSKTIIRWEKSGKVDRARRDWRGWRFYEKQDLKRLKEFKEAIISDSVKSYMKNTVE